MLMSTTPSWLAPTMRRPFCSTRVRAAPRLRRLTVAEPLPALDWAPEPATAWGSALSSCSVSAVPVWRISSLPITLTGLFESTSGRGMREPVTTIASASCASGSAVCAIAVPIIIIVANSAEPPRNPARITATRLLPMSVSPRMDTPTCLAPLRRRWSRHFREQVRDFEHIKDEGSIRGNEKM